MHYYACLDSIENRARGCKAGHATGCCCTVAAAGWQGGGYARIVPPLRLKDGARATVRRRLLRLHNSKSQQTHVKASDAIHETMGPTRCSLANHADVCSI